MQITFNLLDEFERNAVADMIEFINQPLELKLSPLDQEALLKAFDEHGRGGRLQMLENVQAAFGDKMIPEETKAIVEAIAPRPDISAVAAVTDKLDAAGFPWDSRIHSATKTRLANNMWRAKRGVHPDFVKQVESELRQLMSAPAVMVNVTPQVAPMPPIMVHMAPVDPTVAPSPVAMAAPIVPAPPTDPLAIPAFLQRTSEVPTPPALQPIPQPMAAPAAPVTEAPAVTPQNQFVAIVQLTGKAVQNGKLTEDEVKQVCAQYGVPSLSLLAARLDLVPAILQAFQQLIASRGQ